VLPVFGRHGSRALLDQWHRPGRGGQVSDDNPADIKGQWRETALIFIRSSLTGKDVIMSKVKQEGQGLINLAYEESTQNALGVLS
jgi:hypothetical protein